MNRGESHAPDPGPTVPTQSTRIRTRQTTPKCLTGERVRALLQMGQAGERFQHHTLLVVRQRTAGAKSTAGQKVSCRSRRRYPLRGRWGSPRVAGSASGRPPTDDPERGIRIPRDCERAAGSGLKPRQAGCFGRGDGSGPLQAAPLRAASRQLITHPRKGRPGPRLIPESSRGGPNGDESVRGAREEGRRELGSGRLSRLVPLGAPPRQVSCITGGASGPLPSGERRADVHCRLAKQQAKAEPGRQGLHAPACSRTPVPPRPPSVRCVALLEVHSGVLRVERE